MMKYKKVIIGAGLTYVSYKAGKLVGQVKMLKTFIDLMEEVCPGYKEEVCKEMSDRVITKIFNKNAEIEEES